MSIMFNEIYINEEILPIYIYIYMEVNNGKESDSMEKIKKRSDGSIMK